MTYDNAMRCDNSPLRHQKEYNISLNPIVALAQPYPNLIWIKLQTNLAINLDRYNLILTLMLFNYLTNEA